MKLALKSGIYIYICTSCGNPHKHLACDWPWGAITRHSGAQSTATSAQPCFAHSAFDGARSIESGEDKGSAYLGEREEEGGDRAIQTPQITHDPPAGLRPLYSASKSKGRQGFEPRQHSFINHKGSGGFGRDPRQIKTPF